MPREGAEGSGFQTGSTGDSGTQLPLEALDPSIPGTLALPVKLQRHTLAARDLTNSCWDCREPEGAQHCVDGMGFGPSLQLAWPGLILLAVTGGLLFTCSFPAQIPFYP